MEGTFFERHATPGANFDLLTDNDMDTFVRGAPVQESWIGFEVNENRAVTLSNIIFATQNDGNSIIPGFLYELFMWQNGEWQPLGEKVATKEYLEYENIPIDALLWLRCYTRGVEERIFTVQQGRKIWW
jgi:hypothetical protein